MFKTRSKIESVKLIPCIVTGVSNCCFTSWAQLRFFNLNIISFQSSSPKCKILKFWHWHFFFSPIGCSSFIFKNIYFPPAFGDCHNIPLENNCVPSFNMLPSPNKSKSHAWLAFPRWNIVLCKFAIVFSLKSQHDTMTKVNILLWFFVFKIGQDLDHRPIRLGPQCLRLQNFKSSESNPSIWDWWIRTSLLNFILECL